MFAEGGAGGGLRHVFRTFRVCTFLYTQRGSAVRVSKTKDNKR